MRTWLHFLKKKFFLCASFLRFALFTRFGLSALFVLFVLFTMTMFLGDYEWQKSISNSKSSDNVSGSLYAQARKYQYIGAFHCRQCHLKNSGDQYGAWIRSAHKKAYQTLRWGKDRLRMVKEKYNIPDAAKDKRCLRCHTSGQKKLLVNVLPDGRKIRNYEGVGCEACHGPAQKYIEPSIHLSPSGDSRQVKIQHGMWAILGDDGIRLRERMCMRCHRKDRMCSFPGAKGKELSLPIISNFRHDLKY